LETRATVFLADAGGLPDEPPRLHRDGRGGALACAGLPLGVPGGAAELAAALDRDGPDRLAEACGAAGRSPRCPPTGA
jgi:hypothetical protein